MNSIGPRFYALAPHDQAYRIAQFCEEIWAHNPDISLRAFAGAVRLALRSMSPTGRFWGSVRVRRDRVIVDASYYEVSSAPEATYVARVTDPGAIRTILEAP